MRLHCESILLNKRIALKIDGKLAELRARAIKFFDRSWFAGATQILLVNANKFKSMKFSLNFGYKILIMEDFDVCYFKC